MAEANPDPSTPTGTEERRPVILQVLPALVTGGVERGTVDVARAIVEAGGQALVASSGGPMVRELDRIGATHIQLPLDSKNPITIRRNVGRLVKLIEDYGVNLVHARSRAPAWSAWWATRRTGTPFVTTYHGAYNEGGWGLKRRYNSVMVKGDRVIAVSNFIARHIEERHGVDPERVRVIHRGVDLTRFHPAHVSPERAIQLATRWRLPDGYPVIMLPGRLTRWKGQTVLIDALARLGRTDLRCLLVGSDQGRTAYTDELKAQIKRLNLGEVVHIVGECNDMPAAYMLTDVVVSASIEPEAFGRVVVEGQAMGRPVLATNLGGAAETVQPGRTGFLVPPNDPAVLAAGLEHILAMTPEERQSLADDSIAAAETLFSNRAMCDKTLDVYAELLTPAAAPSLDEAPAGDDPADGHPHLSTDGAT